MAFWIVLFQWAMSMIVLDAATYFARPRAK
jgi:hypothetical protein